MTTGDELGRMEELLDAADVIIDSLRSVLLVVSQRGYRMAPYEHLLLSELIEKYDRITVEERA